MAAEPRVSEPPRLADSASRIVDRSLTIVQEELELARIELVEKMPLLGRELIMLIAAAVLAVIGGMLFTLGVAWFLARYVFGFTDVWASFLILAAVVLVPAFLIGKGALRRARVVGPPIPTAAIRQAKLLRKGKGR
jgi:uncharacterized membrane protein YqjE